jgi:hypothetical protein
VKTLNLESSGNFSRRLRTPSKVELNFFLEIFSFLNLENGVEYTWKMIMGLPAR